MDEEKESRQMSDERLHARAAELYERLKFSHSGPEALGACYDRAACELEEEGPSDKDPIRTMREFHERYDQGAET